MDKFDRFQQLHRIFSSRRRPVAIVTIAEKLECTPKHAKKLVHQLRDYWQAPLEYSETEKGWYYDLKQGDKFELPGLWLTADELQSLAALLQLIHSMSQGLVNEELNVVQSRIEKLLNIRGIPIKDFSQHIKYLPLATRLSKSAHFNVAAEAIIKRKQLALVYRDYRNQQTERTVSPQTLVYYRENWHLDAWCHLRNELRTFSISRIVAAELQRGSAMVVSQEQLAEHFTGSYGLFAGKPKHTAKLRFYPEVAREIACQQWHPEQSGKWQGKDYVLSIPYNKDDELVMDILRYGNNVEVLEPAALRKRVKDKLRGALGLYSAN